MAYSWEVLCVDVDEDSEYDDCRAVDEIGFRVAAGLRRKTMDTAAVMVESGNTDYHVTVDGERVPLQPVVDEPPRYLRTLDEDSSTDPLLDLPTCAEYEMEQRLST